MEVETPVGTIAAAQMYSVHVTIFSGDNHTPALESSALGYKGSPKDFDGIIGRDILSKGEFTMSKNRRFTFSIGE